MSDVKHTLGFVRVTKWDPEDEEAKVLFGLPRADSPNTEYRIGTWLPFPSEHYAHEFERRWNCHADLLAACEAMLAPHQTPETIDAAYTLMRAAVLKARATPDPR